MKLITVNELIGELQDIAKFGYGDYTLYVNAECGYSGASIIEGWKVSSDCNKIIELHSDDMD